MGPRSILADVTYGVVYKFQEIKGAISYVASPGWFKGIDGRHWEDSRCNSKDGYHSPHDQRLVGFASICAHFLPRTLDGAAVLLLLISFFSHTWSPHTYQIWCLVLELTTNQCPFHSQRDDLHLASWRDVHQTFPHTVFMTKIHQLSILQCLSFRLKELFFCQQNMSLINQRFHTWNICLWYWLQKLLLRMPLMDIKSGSLEKQNYKYFFVFYFRKTIPVHNL